MGKGYTRHATLALAALLLLQVGSTHAEESERKTKLLSFTPPREFLRAWDGSFDPIPKHRGSVRKCKIGKSTLLLFDLNHNGIWGEVGLDAWTVAKKTIAYAFPWEEAIAVNTEKVTITVSKDQRTATYRTQAHGGGPMHRKCVGVYNEFRMSNGLPPVWIDDTLSKACAAHVRYMDLSGHYSHTQRPGSKGYSEEGAKAGRISVINADTTPLAAITEWWRTVFHRNGVCHPRVRSCGFAFSDEYIVLDAQSDLIRREWTYPVVVPAPGCVDHPTAMMDEVTNPIEKGTSAGCPITLKFGYGSKARVEKAELRVGSKKGKLLPVWASSPAEPATPKRPNNRYNIVLIPKSLLKPLTAYFVHVSWQDGSAPPRSLEWTFKTGKATVSIK